MSDDITLRDTFAAAALTGLMRGVPDNNVYHETLIANQAYGLADAMLRERGFAFRDNCSTGNQREMGCHVTKPMPKEKRAEVSGKPVAWAVMEGMEAMEFCTNKEESQCAADYYGNCCVLPLYRSPTLTDEERKVIQWSIDTLSGVEDLLRTTAEDKSDIDTLRNLLERLK